jgi:hypothetical protein
VRIAAVALVALALAGSAAGGSDNPRVAFVRGGQLYVVDLTTNAAPHVVLGHAALGPVAWSGDGKLLSDAGVIAGGPTLPTSRIAWAPTGETAAYQTADGALHVWTPGGGSKTIVRRTWGVRSFAWGPNGQIALGRKEHPGEGVRAHQEVWVWQSGALRRVLGPLPGDTTPIVEGFAPDGRVLWWDDLFDSGSIRSDGLMLSANGQALGQTLVFSDFVSVCGSHLVFAQGRDRYTTRGKSIVYDGRNVSRDPTRSWVSPSCNGNIVVASAGRSWWERRIGKGELRSLWELLPERKRLTHPPAGWTDEFPRVLPDGSVLFVRTRQTVGEGTSTEHASLDLLKDGSVTPIGSLTTTVSDLSQAWQSNYYGHYGWPQLVAVTA